MALTTIPSELSSVSGIADSSDATAITIDSSENVTTAAALATGGNLTVNGNTNLTGNLTVDSNTLYLDSSNNKIGIGTLFTGGNASSIMTAPLNIKLTSGSSAAVATFNLEHSNSSANIEQRLQFNTGDDGTADSYSNAGYIAFGKENGYVTDDTRDSYLSFATATNATQAERMRITSAGRVGLGGQTAPKEILNVAGAGVFEGDHSTGVNAMNAGTGVLVHASGSVGYITATSSGSNNRDLQIRALNAGSANAGQITLSYTGTTTFTGASSTARIASHSYGTSFETTTSDGSDNMSVSLDAGSGGGSNARGAWWGCYGNEATGNTGNIVGQLGAAGHYKLLGGSSAQSFIRIDQYGSVGFEKANGRVIVGAGYNTTGLYGATSASGIGFFGHDAYSSCGAHIETSTDGDTGWSPFYVNKFNWGSGDDARWLSFGVNGYGTDSGTIAYDGTNFAIVNASDYRLKENIVDYSGGLAKLEELKVRTYNKKEGVSKHITQQGFIAHEAATANIPGFISGEKDAMKTNEAGETVPDYQTVNKEALIPYLVSAIQELSAKVKELESK